MTEYELKLHKLMVKAEECTTHKKAKKILKKVEKTAKKLQEEEHESAGS